LLLKWSIGRSKATWIARMCSLNPFGLARRL
jgi:hypothetical protein